MIEAVTLDATHTLIEPRNLGGEYSRVLARHGLELDAGAAGAAIRAAWHEVSTAADPSRDRFAAHPGGSRGFWLAFVTRVCAIAGVGRPSPAAVADLYDHFVTPEPWLVYDDVRPALAKLGGAGLRLAVVSNWDERLPEVLRRLDLAPSFAAVVVSAEVGVEKPHPAIFAAAVARLGCAPGAILHVGDSEREDVDGARRAGLAALRLARGGGGDLERLTELPERLGAAGAIA